MKTTRPNSLASLPLVLLSPVLALVLIVTALSATGPNSEGTRFSTTSATAQQRDETDYLILFQDPPLAFHRSVGRSMDRWNAHDEVGVTYRRRLLRQQAEAIAEMEKLLARPVSIKHQYTVATNGLSLQLTAAEAEIIADLPSVWLVSPSKKRQPLTDAGPDWIGAPGLWDGSNAGGLPGTQGEGIIIGIIDTGINMDHPSFAGIGGDGYVHQNPFGPGVYVGFCAADPANYICNDKLIGAWSWPGSGDDPEDDNGHGSNVASIAAGNVVTLIYQAPTIILTPTLSGVAPHANLIAYDVCGFDGAGDYGCEDSDSIAAIDQALLDGVDVINFSIGGEVSNPWTDPLALAFLAAREAGVFVAVAAGNGGPENASIAFPANVPWLTTVGNSSHDARFVNSLLSLSGGDTVPPGDIFGSSITAGYGPAPLVYAGDYGDSTCDSAFAAGTWTNGEIVLCDYSRELGQTKKASHVASGGAGGVLIAANHDLWQLLRIDRLEVPGLQLRQVDADALRAWLTGGTGHSGTIGGALRTADPSFGDEVFATSSRGPNPVAFDMLKPNLVAPGTKIWGAFKTTNPADPPEMSFFVGTSQAGPHVAGAAALLRDLHSTWTVAEIESALMTTALTNGVTAVNQKGEIIPAGIFDMGAGRVDLTVAARAGLVLDETANNFRDADPAQGGEVSQLNLASLVDSNCVKVCTWNRQFRSTLSASTSWTVSVTEPLSASLMVSPTQFTLDPGATQLVTVTTDLSDVHVGSWNWGEVRLSEQSAQAPQAHLPVAVRRGGNFLPIIWKP